MNKIKQFFAAFGRIVSAPFHWMTSKFLERHDAVLEKKIRRELEVSLSHELKTPLTSIFAYSELLLESLEKTGNKEDLEAIRLIYKKSQELIRFIDNLINISILEMNPKVLFSTQINISNVIIESVNRFRTFYDIGQDVKIITDIRPDTNVFGNDRLFQNVVFELLSNAYLYSKEKKTAKITVTGKETGEGPQKKYELKIADNGIGIKPGNISHVFDKFFRAEEIDTARTSGLGIGLTLVKRAVGLYSGDIEIASRYGEGTTVTVRFPVYY
ncbi:MAG: hypothetical protein A2Y33_07680 [Spirochaetes bacterium GWF1_51_8]|nr:MAG: hypothetical protein A2Y33_07680 [Spirochaetes bacterium GWF1_51_8]